MSDKKKKHFFSTPHGAYITGITIGASLLIAAIFDDFFNQGLCSAFSNFGYGIIASIVAAFFVDIANTKAIIKSREEDVKKVKSGFKQYCISLKSDVLECCKELGLVQNESYDFKSLTNIFLNKAFEETDGNEEWGFFNIELHNFFYDKLINGYTNLRKQAYTLKYYETNTQYLDFFKANFWEEVNELIRNIDSLETKYKFHVFIEEKANIFTSEDVYDIIVNNILKNIYTLYPDLKTVFEEA